MSVTVQYGGNSGVKSYATNISSYDSSAGWGLGVRSSIQTIGWVRPYIENDNTPWGYAVYDDVNGVHRVIELNFVNTYSASNTYKRGEYLGGNYAAPQIAPDTIKATEIIIYAYAAKWNEKILWATKNAHVASFDADAPAKATDDTTLNALTAVCDDGYIFKSAKINYYDNATNKLTDIDLIISDDGTTAKLGASVEKTRYGCGYMLVAETAEKSSKSINVTNNIADAVETHEYNADNDAATIIITCADGYTFADAVASYTDASGAAQTTDFAVTDNTGTVSISVMANTTVTLSGTVKKVPTIEIVNNIDNATETHTYDADNNALSINITCADGYTFADAVASYTDASGAAQTTDFAVTDNTGTVSISVMANTTVTLSGARVRILAILQTLTNATNDNTDESILQGETYTATITANDGYHFTDEHTPYIEYYDKYGGKNTANGTLINNGAAAVISFDTSLVEYKSFTVVADAVLITDAGDNYGAINIYSVTADEMKQFSTKRYFRETVVATTDAYAGIFNDIDLGQYVNSIKRVFLPVTATKSDVIRCGNYNTEISSHVPDNTQITLNFGACWMQPLNNSAADFDSVFRLFIPFYGFMTIPNTWAGRNIYLKYIIDIVSGKGAAFIAFNQENNIYDVVSVEPSQSLIYKTWNEKEVRVIGGIGDAQTALYGLEPFVYAERYSDYASKRQSDARYITLNNLTQSAQFYKVTDVTLSANDMPDDVRNLIYEQLANGFFVSE